MSDLVAGVNWINGPTVWRATYQYADANGGGVRTDYFRTGARYTVPTTAASKAPACLQVGAFEAAATAYQKALERQPMNWLLMSEIAKFPTFTLRAPESGPAMARTVGAIQKSE